MLLSVIKTIIYILLGLMVFFFVLGNISLMNLKNDKKIKTNHSVGQVSKKPGEQEQAVDELNKYGQQLTAVNDHECRSAKDQIMKNVLFKRKKEQEMQSSLLPNIFKQLAPVTETQHAAPVLENFEDYAPVDTPTNLPINRGNLQLNKCINNVPKAVNEHDTHHTSKFVSEQRAPWSEKTGKDDLSYFFDTHTFDKSFDEIQKKSIVCPVEWEKKTKGQKPL